MPGNFAINYDKSLNTFIVKLVGNISKSEIIHCFKEFEDAIAKHCKDQKFNIITCMDDESHILENLKTIREITSNANFRKFVIKSAGVYQNSDNLVISEQEGNFKSIQDAITFVSD